jgi:DNA-directed RNA polymerase specialized sigma24 family protein
MENKNQTFKKLIKTYKTPLYSYILNMVKDKGIADDIFQEVFIKIWPDTTNGEN